MALRALCLCDGFGGFELGLKLALGNDGIRTVARVERDSYAAAVLVARMEETHLDQAPIWDDLSTFDGSAWRGRVDIITAGIPCQPFSQAGQRRGVDDERWLWADIARIIADVGPRYVFLENVPGLVRAGLPHVLADLADLGFDAEWGLLAASEVGAPHRRDRVWILAVADNDSGRREGIGELTGSPRVGMVRDADRSSGSHVAVTDGSGRVERLGNDDQREREPDAARPSTNVADTESARRDIGRRQAVIPPEIRRSRPANSSRRAFPPRPDDTDGWNEYTAQGGPEPSIRRGPDGRPTWLADALHLGGNGLVPLAAAHAFTQLLERFR